MATEALAPDAINDSTNLTGSVTDIDDDPDSPDGSWLTATSAGAATSCRVGFPTPSGVPNTGAGLQQFRLWLRKHASGGNNPGCQIRLQEGTTVLSTLASITITSNTGELFTANWDASLLGTADGSACEVRVIQLSGHTGGGSARSMEYGAVEWIVDYTAAGAASLVIPKLSRRYAHLLVR